MSNIWCIRLPNDETSVQIDRFMHCTLYGVLLQPARTEGNSEIEDLCGTKLLMASLHLEIHLSVNRLILLRASGFRPLRLLKYHLSIFSSVLTFCKNSSYLKTTLVKLLLCSYDQSKSWGEEPNWTHITSVIKFMPLRDMSQSHWYSFSRELIRLDLSPFYGQFGPI